MVRIMAVFRLLAVTVTGSAAQDRSSTSPKDPCHNLAFPPGKLVDQCVVDGVEVVPKFDAKGPVHPQRAVNALRTDRSASKAECLQSRQTGDLETSVAVRFSGEPKSKGDNSRTTRLLLKEGAPREDCCHPCEAHVKIEMDCEAIPEPDHPATDTEIASGSIGGTESPYEVGVTFFADRCGNPIEIRQTRFIVVSSTWKTSTKGTRNFVSEHKGLVGTATFVNGVLTDVSFANIDHTTDRFGRKEQLRFSIDSEFLALAELKLEAKSSCELDLKHSNEKGRVASAAGIFQTRFELRDMARK